MVEIVIRFAMKQEAQGFIDGFPMSPGDWAWQSSKMGQNQYGVFLKVVFVPPDEGIISGTPPEMYSSIGETAKRWRGLIMSFDLKGTDRNSYPIQIPGF